MPRKILCRNVSIIASLGIWAAVQSSSVTAQQSCPMQSPAEWGKPAPLAEAQVLAYPTQTPRPAANEAQPIVAPDKETRQHGVVSQNWTIDTSNHYAYWVKCMYKGTDKMLSFDISTLKQCKARLTTKGRWMSFSCN